MTETPSERRSRRLGAAGLATMGVLHFAVPRQFDRIIPHWVPGRARTWTYLSGVAELTSAALLARERTRRLGGWAAAATIAGVYPANIQMALDNPPRTRFGVAAWLRLPLQLPMLAWALKRATGSCDSGRPLPQLPVLRALPVLRPGTSGRASSLR